MKLWSETNNGHTGYQCLDNAVLPRGEGEYDYNYITPLTRRCAQ